MTEATTTPLSRNSPNKANKNNNNKMKTSTNNGNNNKANSSNNNNNNKIKNNSNNNNNKSYNKKLSGSGAGHCHYQSPASPSSSSSVLLLLSSSDSLHSTTTMATSTTTSSSSSYNNNNNDYYQQQSYPKRTLPGHGAYIAMDCEMVGDVLGRSYAARVVLIDWKGRPLLDTYCQVPPGVVITDYRTAISGIEPHHLQTAPSLQEVQQWVGNWIGNNNNKNNNNNNNDDDDVIVVGHALWNDFAALQLPMPPPHRIRDTATYEPFLQPAAAACNVVVPLSSSLHSSSSSSRKKKTMMMPRKLRDLVREFLHGYYDGYDDNDTTTTTTTAPCDTTFQRQQHCPLQDARAALHLYKQHRPRWEACVQSQLSLLSVSQGQQQLYHQSYQHQPSLPQQQQLDDSYHHSNYHYYDPPYDFHHHHHPPPLPPSLRLLP